jgi:hypothetical protein
MKKICLALLALSTAAWSQIPDSTNPYVRKVRSGAVSLELGGNTLASVVGVKGTFFVKPQVAIDAGLGLSMTGLRPGIQARYLFTRGKFAPFAYGGLKYGLGTGDTPIEIKDENTGEEGELTVEPSPFLDFGVGIDYLAHNGFYFTTVVGWSQLLGGQNYEWVGGFPPSDDLDNGAEIVFGSGLAFGFSLGYAF